MKDSQLAQDLRPTIITVVFLSALLNLLVLAGSIYMMLVYDMVIPSRNPVSLVGLLAILLVAYAFQTGFDLLRSDLLRRAAADIYARYTKAAYLTAPTSEGDPVADLDTVRSYISGPGPGGIVDLPWMVLYLAVLFMIHIWIGVTALAGILILIGLSWLTNDRMIKPTDEATTVGYARNRFLQETRGQADALTSLGMRGRVADLWQRSTDTHLGVQQRLSSVAGNFSGLSKSFRMLLQSLILTVGALLVISDKASGGVIFASSIISSRALAPMEATVASWKPMLAARKAWGRIKGLHSTDLRKMPLTAPTKSLEVEDLTFEVPGRKTPVLSGIRFQALAGDIVAVIGPSAAGKTTLLRALAGQITSVQQDVRLDGASLDQWEMDDLGRHLGYLSQDVAFLSGTVTQNISRFDEEPDPEVIRKAAEDAGAHDMIVRMHDGYNALMAPNGAGQSGGQRQRIGLARALYGDPFLIILDEPNSNLDAEGEAALGKALEGARARGAVTIIASHRPAIIQAATHILVLRDGVMQAHGRKEDILPKLLGRNAA